MKGWKTWTAAFLVGLSTVAPSLGYPELSEPILTIAAAFGLIGLGHKIEKR